RPARADPPAQSHDRARRARVPTPAPAAAQGGRGLEGEVLRSAAGGHLAVAAADEHERVGYSGARDHVRLLPGERLEQDGAVLHARARAHERTARIVPAA